MTNHDRSLENLRSRAFQETEALYSEVETENARIVSSHPELAARMAGESRCLRAIWHTVIKDMARQIA